MANRINTVKELQEEKDKLKQLGEEQLKAMKSNLKSVRIESKNVLVNKILIPVGTAILVGYGVKKLIDTFQSDDQSTHDVLPMAGPDHDPPVYHRPAATEAQSKNGFLSNVDWSATALKMLPFVLSVGKKLYEEGHLPFLEPPSDHK